MKEQLDMFISFDTTLEDIETLRTEMEKFIRSPENSRDFQPDILLECTGIGNMDKLQLKVEIRHKSNWHNETVRASRRSKFMCALVLALRKVPIYGPGGGGTPLGDPNNPSYSVAVSDELAAAARDKAKEAKEAKRLIPSITTTPAEESTTNTTTLQRAESKAAEALNSRRPTEDAARDQNEDTVVDDYWESAGAANAAVSSSGTLNDPGRLNEISDLREGLLKRQSTRGKRRMGETIRTSGISITSANTPGLSFTGASPREEAFDEEAEMGLDGRYTDMGYTGTGYQGASGVGNGTGYSTYNTQERTAQGATGVVPAGRSTGLTSNSQSANQNR